MEESIVQKKLAKLIQKEVSDIVMQGKYLQGVMLTVSLVRVTADLSLAKIYVSCFPDQRLEEAATQLNESAWEIRKGLASRIKNKVRKIPELRFYADDTLQEVEKIEELLDKINPTQTDTSGSQDTQ